MRVIVVGRQGSGKGTQCKRLARRLGVPHVSTGDAFRAAMGTGSELGRLVAGFVDAGELVPDEIVVQVIAAKLASPALAPGFVLDGFPRTAVQARRLLDLLAPTTIDVVLDLRVERDVVVRRLLRRRVCLDCGGSPELSERSPVPIRCPECGGVLARRSDDTQAAIERRLECYGEDTHPMLDWFAAMGWLRTVDGNGSADEVARRVALSIALVEDYARRATTAAGRG